MHVMVVHHTPSLTRERYEAVVRGLTGGKHRLESPDDVPTGGLLVHVAAETDQGFMIFDVFESQEAFERFRALASPIATEAGIEEPPKSFPAPHVHLLTESRREVASQRRRSVPDSLNRYRAPSAARRHRRGPPAAVSQGMGPRPLPARPDTPPGDLVG